MTIQPGVVVGAGIKFLGGRGGMFLSVVRGPSGPTRIIVKLEMSQIYEFGGKLILSRSSSSHQQGITGGKTDGPFMELDANLESIPWPVIKFKFRAFLKMWDFLAGFGHTLQLFI